MVTDLYRISTQIISKLASLPWTALTLIRPDPDCGDLDIGVLLTELLGICFWREGIEVVFGPERRGEETGFLQAGQENNG
jgi:hypothetical protein